MSRPGITYQDVANAASQLIGQTENPTVDRVREILGTGSKSTISKHLRDWKSSSEQSIHATELPEELLSMLKGLWERVKAEANECITQHEQAFQQRLTIVEQQLAETEQANHHLRNNVAQLQEEFNLAQTTSQTLHTTLENEKRTNSKLTERNDRLAQQLQDQKNETERLHQLLAHVQKNLEHYQHSIQVLREEQSLIIEKQKTDFEQKIQVLKQNLLNAATEKNTIETESKQMQFRLNSLDEQFTRLNTQYQQLQNQLQEKRLAESILRMNYQQIEEKNYHYQNNISEQNQHILALEKNAAVLSAQVTQLQTSLTHAEEKIKQLHHEKLTIVQEKSYLEGQLLNMQNNTEVAKCKITEKQ